MAQPTLWRDDLGDPVPVDRPRRVISLVPSLTEAIAALDPGLLVAATDWCTHPAGLDVPRVGGTKNPDLDAVVALRPDLVVANEEENKPEHLRRLRERGVPVWVTDIRDVDGAIASIGRLCEALTGVDSEPRWLERARREWASVRPVTTVNGRRPRAVVAVWRRPWMFVGRDTYAGDVLARLGVDNALAASQERYPARPLDDLPPHEVVVLPDEPYRFTVADGPEVFAAPAALVDGRALTWYGPAMVGAPAGLRASLAAALAGSGGGLSSGCP